MSRAMTLAQFAALLARRPKNGGEMFQAWAASWDLVYRKGASAITVALDLAKELHALDECADEDEAWASRVLVRSHDRRRFYIIRVYREAGKNQPFRAVVEEEIHAHHKALKKVPQKKQANRRAQVYPNFGRAPARRARRAARKPAGGAGQAR